MPAPTLFNDGTSPTIVTKGSFSDGRPRLLKEGDTFSVFNNRGEITTSDLGELGFFHESTRFLSRLVMWCDQLPLILLSSDALKGTGLLVATFTNADLARDDGNRIPFGSLHIHTTTFLLDRVCVRQIRIKNYYSRPVRATISICFGSDFADIFEIRGAEREVRGLDYPPEIEVDRVTLGYTGLDREKRETVIQFSPPPSRLYASKALLDLSLDPKAEASYTVQVGCKSAAAGFTQSDYTEAFDAQLTARQGERGRHCAFSSSDERFDRWIGQASSDLLALTTQLPTGPYPYAGLPWFSAPFGRDGIFTAMECLWAWPELARGVLSYLASTQANSIIASQDAEPGKILHETRSGEMAALGEMPFAKYYGSVDATPLFVMLAGLYFERTGDLEFVRGLWPKIEAALSWIDDYGSNEGNGFVYYRNSSEALAHQGWKDSNGAICNSDGSPATGPLALCEVQAYVYGARMQASTMAACLGLRQQGASLEVQASKLREDFDRSFWCEDLATYALAIDGDGQPCRVRTSNAGHCLFTGIAMPIRAAQLVETLLDDQSFSGWGVRTMSSLEPNFNPMGYHTGCVWPHENSLIASGLVKYGHKEAAFRLLEAQLDASSHFEYNRMPELFCGFTRAPGESPSQYPVACSPQAWAAASVFLFLQCSLGFEIDGSTKEIVFREPRLPGNVRELWIRRLAFGDGDIDLLLARENDSVAIHVLRNPTNVSVRLIT